MAVYQAWDFQGGRIRQVSNVASMKFLPLSCGGHHSQAGDRLPPHDVVVQFPLKLFDPSAGQHWELLSQLITQQECGSPVTFLRGTGRKATAQRREENAVHFRGEIIECYCDGKHWADNRQGQISAF